MNYLRFFTVVREKSSCIVERFGKFHKSLEPGIHFMVPVMDQIAYRQSLKEEAIQIDDQTAITKDNVTIHIDGTLFIQILDPIKASYQVEKPFESVKLLALTVLRSEIGKMKLDKLFQERGELNHTINQAVNNACAVWGLTCLRYEILNIEPPQEIKNSMQYEAEAERLKRREILISEGKQKAQINLATGRKITQIKQAEGRAESLKIISQKEAEGLREIAQSFSFNENAKEIISYLLTQNYITNYKNTLKNSNLVVTPQSGGNGKQSSELLSMAALMMLQKQNGGGQLDSQVMQQYLRQMQGQQNGSQQSQLEQEINMNDVISKMQYYDDPLLYGDHSHHSHQESDKLGGYENEKDEYNSDQQDKFSNSTSDKLQSKSSSSSL